MEKYAVVTIAMGDNYKSIARMTHPSIRAYADKIGAEFVVLDEMKLASTTPHWEKFQLYHMLNHYHRIIFLDTDLIIRPDCPNLIDLVPFDKLGICQDISKDSYMPEMMEACKTYKVELKEWDGKYYNTGVLVLSRVHKFLFKKPALETWNYYEQTYLNMKMAETKVALHALDYKFNRTKAWDNVTGEHRLCSYIVHYAGVLEGLHGLIPGDLARWEAKEHERLRRHVCLAAYSKLGDNVCAEPVFRYAMENAYPNAEFIIAARFPEVFQHLSGRAQVVRFEDNLPYKPDQPYLHMNGTSYENHPSREWMNGSNMHCIDWLSLLCFRHTLPLEYKRPKLHANFAGIEEALGLVRGPLDEVVVVHPGKGWASKTFPASWWNEVIAGIAASGKQAVIVGKSDKYTSYVDVSVPPGVVDIREMLSLNGLIALLSKARVLVSNDSAPIHMAGAFDNWIVLIPTCKHPDHVLPYRNQDRYWRTKSLYRKLMRDLIPFDPIAKIEEKIPDVHGDMLECLPEPIKVVEAVGECF